MSADSRLQTAAGPLLPTLGRSWQNQCRSILTLSQPASSLPSSDETATLSHRVALETLGAQAGGISSRRVCNEVLQPGIEAQPRWHQCRSCRTQALDHFRVASEERLTAIVINVTSSHNYRIENGSEHKPSPEGSEGSDGPAPIDAPMQQWPCCNAGVNDVRIWSVSCTSQNPTVRPDRQQVFQHGNCTHGRSLQTPQGSG